MDRRDFFNAVYGAIGAVLGMWFYSFVKNFKNKDSKEEKVDKDIKVKCCYPGIFYPKEKVRIKINLDTKLMEQEIHRKIDDAISNNRFRICESC